MDAIEERTGNPAGGSMRVKLLESADLAAQVGDSTPVIDGFEITDDGVGFTDANLVSFGETNKQGRDHVPPLLSFR
jgi:hypothetical protein